MANPSASGAMPSDAIPAPVSALSGYLARLQSSLQPPTRSAALLPSPADLSFHRSLDRSFSRGLDEEADRILGLVGKIVKWVDQGDTEKGSAKGKGKARMEDEDLNIDGFARGVGELVDELLEKADVCLDEYTGKIVPRQVAKTSSASRSQIDKPLPKNGPLPARILNAPITPPQRKFTTQPDNSSTTPWSRQLRMGKPHAQVPLHWRPPPPPEGAPAPQTGTRRGMYCAEGDPITNPYHYEITHVDYPQHLFQAAEPREAQPLAAGKARESTAESPFVWVDSPKLLAELLEHLKEARVTEIAIDLEHHSYRSYQGVVPLMQLSTRWGDWVIDTLVDGVREELESFNVVFADPSKVKVLHGADHDVLWLQRDFGLYLVNLFDTYHATNVLSFPAHGLAYLLSHYVGFIADKRYQLADWRIRPLPDEMLYYARSDTHALLFVYDHLRNDLLKQGGMQAVREVLKRSEVTATRVYAKEEWDEQGESREGWRTLWRKWGGEVASGERSLEQMGKEERLVRKLHWWRDQIARQEDESPRYILSAANLMSLAQRAPITASGALACFTPGPPALRSRAVEAAQIIANELAEWEAAQERERTRRTKELKDLAKASEGGIDPDVGEKVQRKANEDVVMAEVTATAHTVANAGVPLVRTESAVVTSLWTAFASTPKPNSAPQAAAQTLASSLFGRPVKRTAQPTESPAPPTSARLVAQASELFGRVFRAGTGATTPAPRASLFARPAESHHTSASTSADKLARIRTGFAEELRGIVSSIQATGDATIEEEQNHVPIPETVPFVPRTHRAAPNNSVSAALSASSTERPIPEAATKPVRGPSSESVEPQAEREEIVQVGKKKKRWTTEEKRQRKEERAASTTSSAEKDPAKREASKDEIDTAPQKKKARKSVDAAISDRPSSSPAPLAPFDYSTATSVLDAPPPARSMAKKNRDKGKRDGKGKEKEKEKSFAPAPRKRNEPASGNRSHTFA